MRKAFKVTVWNVRVTCDRCGRKDIAYTCESSATRAKTRLPDNSQKRPKTGMIPGWNSWDMCDGEDLCLDCAQELKLTKFEQRRRHGSV